MNSGAVNQEEEAKTEITATSASKQAEAQAMKDNAFSSNEGIGACQCAGCTNCSACCSPDAGGFHQRIEYVLCIFSFVHAECMGTLTLNTIKYVSNLNFFTSEGQLLPTKVAPHSQSKLQAQQPMAPTMPMQNPLMAQLPGMLEAQRPGAMSEFEDVFVFFLSFEMRRFPDSSFETRPFLTKHDHSQMLKTRRFLFLTIRLMISKLPNGRQFVAATLSPKLVSLHGFPV